jgi:peptidyl-prolyl cis-trans isomerase B (cyclophilin B)
MFDGKMQPINFSESPVFRQIIVDAKAKPEPESLPPVRVGGCLIATASYGSELAPQVQQLRELRDNTVLQTESGAAFMTGFNQFYYSFSPMIADYERENPAFKEAVKLTITPLLISLTLLQHADIDSEHEMLVYGIAVILLNIGMYFVAPAVLITKIRSFYKLQ